jgi:uncharacterized protein (DUF924 family)
LALRIAQSAIDRRFDQLLTNPERSFLYMPYMHSESLETQEEGIRLFNLVNQNFARFAEKHRDIVARFGRFPHRNVILGRPSTPEEVAFLQEEGSSF